MLEFKATLRISSTKYTLEQLRSLLGDPTKGFSLGDAYSNGRKKRTHTYWALESSCSSEAQLERHLNELLDYIAAKSMQFSNIKKECDMDIFCMLSSDNGQGGATLPSETMKRLSDQALNLVFDIYIYAGELG